MADNNESTVSTASGQEEKQKQNKKGKKKGTDPNKIQKIIKFIAQHAVAVGYIAAALLIIIFIIGILQILITMPGLILGKLKEFGTKILAATEGFFNGNNIDKRITKEQENEMAQYIQDMGYDIIGFGFGDVKTKEKTEETEESEDNDEETESQIELLNGDRNYIKQYLVQNAAIYTPAVWNIKGAFESLTEEETAQDYAVGMLDITTDGKHTNTPKLTFGPITGLINAIKSIKESLDYRVSVDAENKVIKLSKDFGETYYFDMSNWASKYGKPMELFLAVHLSTMMPDLAYDLATADCFNTKVHIDFQPVKATYTVSYLNQAGKTLNQDDIRTAIHNLFSDEFNNDLKDNNITDITEIALVVKFAGDDYFKENVCNSEGMIITGDLAGLTKSQVKGLYSLIALGTEEKDMYYPRITEVTKHWYYDTIKFNYGQAEEAMKQIMYEPEDKNNALYGVSGIILNTTMTAKEGVYYQLEEPELEGPNDAIKELFTGGKGTRDNVSYDFPGEYYRFDGTRARAQEILNAKALDKNKNTYKYQGETNWIHEKRVFVEPVVVYDDNKKNSYKNAYTAFAMLEKANTEESEVSYRCLKNLFNELNYFKEDIPKDPVTQVLKWFLPDIEEKDRRTKIINDSNVFGMIVIGNEEGNIVQAPGDAIVKEANTDEGSITLEFTELNANVVSQLNEKIGNDEFLEVDDKSVYGLQMVISGINPTVEEGKKVTVDQTIGTAKGENQGRIHFYLKNSEGSIIDNIGKYIDIYNKNKYWD